MKKILKYIAATCLGIISLNSCSDDDAIIKLNPENFVAPTITSTALTANLSENTQTEIAYIFNWTAANYGTAVVPNYTIEVTKEGYSFQNAKALTKTQSLTYEVDGTTLNSFLIEQLELTPGTETTIQYRIVASLGTFSSEPIASEIRTITLTPFTTNLSTPWGIVGTITNWGGTPDIPFWKTTTPDVLVAYLGLEKGDLIKFRKDSDWAVNFGSTTVETTSTGFSGSLTAGSSDISVPTTGQYKITIDLRNPGSETFKAEFFQWGIVGSAATNGWDGPDKQVLSFDGIHKVWYANNVTLANGEIKFRQNNAWDINYGGSNGNLELGGDNIIVTAGTYNIIVDFENLTYSLTPVP